MMLYGIWILGGGSVVGRVKAYRREKCRWIEQYFNDNIERPFESIEREFRDTFGVPTSIFREIESAVYHKVRVGPDGSGKEGMPVRIAVLTTCRMLRTGNPAVQFVDQTGYGVSTISSKFEIVLSAIVQVLSCKYLRLLDSSTVKQALRDNAKRGLVGCVGSIDCFSVTRIAPKISEAICRTGGKEGRNSFGVQVIVTYDNCLLSAWI